MALTCAQKLEEAKGALHALIMGESIVKVTTNGRTNEYTAADEGKLRRYIAELESECGDATRGHLGPVGFHG